MFPEYERYIYIGIVAVVGIILLFFSQPSSDLSKIPESGEKIILPKVTKIENIESKKPDRDPFEYASGYQVVKNQEGVTEEVHAQMPEIQLKGIAYNDTRRFVNIEDEWYSEGESFHGAEIFHIFPDRVEFRFNNKIVTIALTIPVQEIEKKGN